MIGYQLFGVLKIMKTKLLALSVTLFTGFAGFASLANSQEFVVSQSQINSQNVAQENCPQEVQSSGQSNISIDRAGIDKASIHLQVLQQAGSRFSESGNAKKPAAEDKKAGNKSQENS
jgi:hypothetical protein